MTVREISRLTGLSTTTVCKALRNPSSVRESTWQEIEKVCGDRNSTGLSCIHVVLPDLKNSFFGNLLEGCIDALSHSGLAPLVYLSKDDPTLEKKFSNVFPTEVIKESYGFHLPIRWIFSPPHRSIVVADRDCDCKGVLNKVLLDNTNLAFHGVEYLVSFNPERIFFINGPKESSTSQNREEGAHAAAKKFGVKLEVFYADFIKEKKTNDIVLKLLAHNPPGAFLLGNQSIAFGFLQAFSESKLLCRPPCITFDRLPEIFSPPLSFIDLPAFRIGEKATQLLLNRKLRDKGQTVFTIQGILHCY